MKTLIDKLKRYVLAGSLVAMPFLTQQVVSGQDLEGLAERVEETMERESNKKIIEIPKHLYIIDNGMVHLKQKEGFSIYIMGEIDKYELFMRDGSPYAINLNKNERPEITATFDGQRNLQSVTTQGNIPLTNEFCAETKGYLYILCNQRFLNTIKNNPEATILFGFAESKEVNEEKLDNPYNFFREESLLIFKKTQLEGIFATKLKYQFANKSAILEGSGVIGVILPNKISNLTKEEANKIQKITNFGISLNWR